MLRYNKSKLVSNIQKIALKYQIWTIERILIFEKGFYSLIPFIPIWDMFLNYIPALTNSLDKMF